MALAQLPVFDPTQLYILQGDCPSEGGVHLPFATDVFGAGAERTLLDDTVHFYWSSHSDPELEGMFERHDFTDVQVREIEGHAGGGFEYSGGQVILEGARVSMVDLSFDYDARLEMSQSIVDSVNLWLGGSLVMRQSILGAGHVSGHEDGSLSVVDSTIGSLTLTNKVHASVSRTIFGDPAGVAVRFDFNTYPWGSLTVSDSRFAGYDRHVWVTCNPGVGGPCGPIALTGNTLAHSKNESILTDGYDPTPSFSSAGNAFFDIGASAIVALGTPAPVVTYNNFDAVGGALCVGANCFTTGADVNGSGYGHSNLDEPSGFVAPGDYRLASTSALIDAGDPNAVGTDLDGLPRPFDGDFDGVAVTDIGAYEFTDPDQDGVTTPLDNCPELANADQADADSDAVGDACDPCTDADADGFGDPGFPASTCLLDNCPTDPNPGQEDADADGSGDVCDSCTDADQDGFGAGTLGNASCANGPAVDCDDLLSIVYPGAPQLCDGIANDCLDPIWPTVPADEADADTDGFRICAGDCDDTLAGVFPGAAEICNAIDDDCDAVTDEDELGADSDGDFVANACDNCRLAYNPDQLDTDADGIGNSCDNCFSLANSDQADIDADGWGDVCDNCAQSYNPLQDDWDGDQRGDLCDNCPFEYNPGQGDLDTDSEGDFCDLNDGLILLYSTDPNYMEWQVEQGYESWNSYKGDLEVLRATGVYTQAPGSNDLARRECDLTDPWIEDSAPQAAGSVAYFLTTGIAAGVESSLGTDSVGNERLNQNPCP